jgi:hypothetical protein
MFFGNSRKIERRDAGMMINRDQILEIAGPLPDETVVQIERVGPTEVELTEAVAWLARGTSIGRESRHQLTGVVGDLFDLIAAEGHDVPETS